jgi:hypothetical protein
MTSPIKDATIAVRTFVDDGSFKLGLTKPKSSRAYMLRDIGQSDFTLIFDTETFTDAALRLRFGCYQLRHGRDLDEAGIFYDPESLTDQELALVASHANLSGLKLMTQAQFIEAIFYGVGYELGATIVGLNLPFDISRMAIRHATARSRKMRGGFSFFLSPDENWPAVQVKHLSRNAALIRFAGKRGQKDGRGTKRRKMATSQKRGYFVDVKTLAAALTSKGFGLARLAEFLELDERKHQTSEHDLEITETYLNYAMQDVQTTWACYEALTERYDQHKLTKTPPYAIYSEAGLGKACFKEMAIKPWKTVQQNMPSSLIGRIMSTYYGGRSEVRIRRTITQVAYCDFLSMYVSVSQ